jgi:hypothetical protein
MSAQLSRIGFVGVKKESVPGTYEAPTAYIPVIAAPVGEDVIAPIRDESYRNNDTVLQGLYGGPADSTFAFDTMAYPDVIGHVLRAIIGPDTVTAGVTTTLASNSAANATSLLLTASVASNSVIQISDAAGANLEYVKIGVVTGAGPYTAPVSVGGGSGGNSTLYAHTAAGGSVISQSSHLFKQNPAAAQASYSITKYDVASNAGATHSRGFPGCKLSEAAFKIDPKAALTASTKWMGFPSATSPDPTPTFSSIPSLLGWQWTMTNGGGSSTRGITYDLTLKRAQTEVLHTSTGTQGPREVFQSAFEADGTYKALFESDADLTLFLSYLQQPVTATLTQPTLLGGQSLALTSSRGGIYKGVLDMTGAYITASFDLSGIYNGTDTGALSATLVNFVAGAF